MSSADQPAQPGPSTPSQGGSLETLQCQWNGCGERAATAEQLYDHVCERHVGRKSTNNLNLTCQWGNCRTTTVKRDHITSHIRVHVPLKPHKCDFCGKAFKRPQDLKKHVKTHADDSVILRSPEPVGGGSRHQPNNGGYNMGQQHKPQNYYDQPLPSNAPLGYGHQTHNGAQGYYAPTQQPQSTTYGPVYYTVNHSSDINHNATYDQRRGYEALNDFFGDAKRRGFDPNSYTEVGTRLMAIQGVQLPMVGGGGGGMVSYQAAHPPMMNIGGGQVGVYAPTAQHGYALPLPNLRTKNDLTAVDQFLEQMTTTVYEHPNSAAAAGVQLPVAHYSHNAMGFRQTHSPPALQLPSSHNNGYSAAPLIANGSSQSNHSGTPALTPPSSASVISHSAGHSPSSLPSNNAASPPNSGMMMYPTLPSANAASLPDYASASGSAPPSTLGPSFDSDSRRRYSGGRLQKAQPSSRAAVGVDVDDDLMDTHADDNDRYSSKRSPSDDHDSAIKREQPRAEQIIDPALADMMTSPQATEPSESSEEKIQAEWVENIRVIEGLKRYVQ
ncbi:MAG: hypothetical protein LQ347_003837, partial [Umbilicaria vellea]